MWCSSGKNQNFNRSSPWWSFLFIFLILNTYISFDKPSNNYISAGNHNEICWNEKFAFEFPSSEWENLTHLKFKVMAEECLFEGGFVGVGETMWAVLTQKRYSFSVFIVNYQPCNAFVGLSNNFFGLSARKSIIDWRRLYFCIKFVFSCHFSFEILWMDGNVLNSSLENLVKDWICFRGTIFLPQFVLKYNRSNSMWWLWAMWFEAWGAFSKSIWWMMEVVATISPHFVYM